MTADNARTFGFVGRAPVPPDRLRTTAPAPCPGWSPDFPAEPGGYRPHCTRPGCGRERGAHVIPTQRSNDDERTAK